AETVGAVIAQVAGGVCGVRPAAARAGVPYTTARGWVRRFCVRAGELGTAFAALAVELGGEPVVPRPAADPRGFALAAIGAVIAEAASDRLTPAERGALARQIAARAHTHPDGTARRYSRGTIDRWLRAWRAGGLAALQPSPRADTGTVRAHPELFAEAAALRLELPGRSAAQIASILFHRHGIAVAERTIRAQLRRAGLHREALAAEPKAYGRYEAARPNERWISDVLI